MRPLPNLVELSALPANLCVLLVLKDEMESVMKLIGISDLSQVHPGLVNTADVDHLVPSGKGHPYATWRPSSRL